MHNNSSKGSSKLSNLLNLLTVEKLQIIDKLKQTYNAGMKLTPSELFLGRFVEDFSFCYCSDTD